VGLTPISLTGSTDQHSFLQLIIEGVKDKTLTFIKVKDFGIDLKVPNISIENLENTNYINEEQFQTLINAQCDATLQSILDSGVPVDLIEIETLDEKNLGELIIYFELLTSLVGILFNVNTYDQPGVELGKKILVEKFKKA
jgi:glucose-6-phosphate isomerase